MRMPMKMLERIVLLYLTIPFVIFLAGWIRPCIGLPALVLVAVAVVQLWRGRGDREDRLPSLADPDDEVRMSWKMVAGVLAVILVWCMMAGQGGFVVQTEDWAWRNATMRDLITHDWPVRYDAWNRALVFYVGHWMVASVIGKLALWMSGSLDVAWRAANVVLLIWTATGIALVYLQMVLLLKSRTAGRQIAALALLVFFGGLDALGAFVLNCKQLAVGSPLDNSWWNFGDWWPAIFNFTSNSTLLYWVYHQTVASWIVVLLLARGARVAWIGFVIPLLLLNGPLPASGIVVIGGAAVLAWAWPNLQSRQFRLVVRKALALPNLIGAFVVFPIVWSYLSSNPQSGNFSFAWTSVGTGFFFRRYLVFICCEIGLYVLLTARGNRCGFWWWVTVGWLITCPLIRVGNGNDFCMRASIPAMMLLSIIVFRTVDTNWMKARFVTLALLGCLAVGAYVPAKEMCWYVYHLSQKGFGVVVEDWIVTFDRDFTHGFIVDNADWVVANCCCQDPNSKFFYRWIGRKAEK